MRRRRFLSFVARASAATAAMSAIPPWVARAAPEPPADFIERSDWPEQWETTLGSLGRSWVTENDLFFVRSHFPVPDVDPKSWRLEVSGLVRAPLTLALPEIQAMRPVEVTHTLECAGNGRGLWKLPSTSGTQWERGAVGNAIWSGVRMSELLERAGVDPTAKHLWFEAADHATMPAAPPFLRSIPIEKAMKDGVLAYGMNRAPLPRLHGAPLRAIVPGWYGMASTKWVTRVRLEATPSDNHFMAKGYRYVHPDEDPAQAKPVEEMRIKSVIVRPLEDGVVAKGKVRVRGFAWAGTAGVRLVEISTDGGKEWRPAGFMGDRAEGAWRTWATDVDVRSGARITVMARATDGAGEVQPLEARPNAGGYGNNSIHSVSFRVGA